MTTIYTDVAAISYGKDRIVRIKITEKAKISLKDTKELAEAIHKLTDGEKYLALVYFSNTLSISKHATAYVAEANQNDPCIANAIIVKTSVSRVIGNLYVNFNKPKRPTSLFSEEDKAIEWLKQFLYLTQE